MENNKTVLKLIITAMIGVSVLGTVPSISEATPSNSSNFSERIDSLSSKEAEAEEKLKDIVLSISKTEEEAAVIVKQLEQTAEELEGIKEEIDVLSDQISQREDQLKSQVRAVQVTGQSGSMLRFILEAETLSDVFGRLDVVSVLFSANQGLMEKQIEDQALVEVKERETVEKQEEQTLMAAKLENKKVELEEQKAEQEVLVATIAAEKAELNEEREAFLVQQRESQRRRDEIQSARRAAEQATVMTVSNTPSSEEVSISSNKQSEKAKTPAPTTATGSAVSIAQSLIGSRYVFAGSTPAGFDCSGFTSYVFQRAGRSIPRNAAAQFGASRRLSQSEAKPGDLIFFNQSGSIDHVGIYLGGGRFIGSQTSTGVAVASFTSGYWSRYVAGFGRP